MVVYLKNGQRKCYYSLVNEEERGDAVALRNMTRRLLERLHRGKYQTALVIDRYSNKILTKYVDGKIEIV
jgi:hypothetical protein